MRKTWRILNGHFRFVFKAYIFFTFFDINRRKYWSCENFRLPFFDGFTFLGCQEHELIISGKCVSVCAWQKFCGKFTSRTYHRNFMKFKSLELFKHKLISINFWWKLLNMWHCSHFFRNFWYTLIPVSSGWNCTKNYM